MNTQFTTGNTSITNGNKHDLFKLVAVNGWNKKARHSKISMAHVGWDIEDINGKYIGFIVGNSPMNAGIVRGVWSFVTNWENFETFPHEVNTTS
jgi:hypothetical protein